LSDTTHHGATLVASGTLQAGLETIAALRRQPGGPNLPPTLLKHSDEQTVVGLAAVLRATTSEGLRAEDFRLWGVVAAPCHLGRRAVADTFARVADLGSRGASPMVIPHRSLHSVSGTISQALGINGPNIGVGGGPGNLAEGLLTALTLLDEGCLPGLWLVLTQWRPEPPLGGEDASAICHALALALTPAAAGRSGLLLRLLPAAEMSTLEESVSVPGIAELAEVFTLQPGLSRGRLFRFEWGGGLEVASTQVLWS
jgi:hypothetical protein